MSSFSDSLFHLSDAPNSSYLELPRKVQGHAIFWAGAILGLVVLCAIRYLESPYRKLPPGPRGYPIIGNLLDLRAEQWLKFAEWRKTYGDLIYLSAAGQPIVVLNSKRAAVDLLDRRAGIYSDRPRNIVACDLMTNGLLFALARYGDVWRRMRKVANEGFNKGSVKRFHEAQTAEAIILACDWLVESAERDGHFRRAAASMIMSVVYGRPPITSGQDPSIQVVNEFTERLTRAALPGAHFVEFFTWMRYIPSSLAKWKRIAEDRYKQDSAMLEGLFHEVEADVAKGDYRQSLCAKLIRESKLSLRENSWLAGTMYIAGSESSSSMMAWWTLAMLAYPETQARAHAELDAVVGRGRLPTFADYTHLHYIRAMVKELLRWRPVAPLALPHQSTEDDWYEGMFIPKGTICLANVWHINHDPETYGENAAHFEPARYLDANGDLVPGPSGTKEEGHVSYGFGRRECPGRHVANNSLFIDIAIVLWAMKIERKKDRSGQLIPLDVDGFVDQGIVVRPVPFECEIIPRFPEAPTLLVQEREMRGL
ncbi:cytochrome P450 [Russula brevipes]|nr:cytochrome P450 [Russula brevipes]